MDRLEAMSLLLQVVEAGSLSAVARRRNIPLATLSRKISDLEAHLRTQLLLRSSRKLALTDAGQAYIAACRQIIDSVEEAERLATGEFRSPKGDLVVTSTQEFGRLHATAVIADFLNAYPEIDIKLVLSDRRVDLLADHIDIAIRMGQLPDSSLKALPVGWFKVITCASRDYLDAHGAPETPADLIRHSCVSIEGIFEADIWNFQQNGERIAVPIHSRLLVNSASASLAAARAGAGIARLLSYQLSLDGDEDTLVRVLTGYEPDPVPVNLVYAAHRLLPLKLRAFLDFAAPRLRARLAQP